jgi:hypothetical protein
VFLPRHFDNHFKVDGRTKRNACDTIRQACLSFAKTSCCNPEAASATFG